MAANVRSALLPPSLLQQIAKFFHRHPGIFYYPAHRQSVHRVVTRYGDEMRTVAHDNVFALADNLKSRLFECLHAWGWEYTVRGRRWMDYMGRMVMRPSDREIASQFSASTKPILPLRARRNHEHFRLRRQDNPQWHRECSASLPARFLLETNNREARGNSPRNLLPTYEARSDIVGSSQNFIS